jgi:hypothetical protein
MLVIIPLALFIACGFLLWNLLSSDTLEAPGWREVFLAATVVLGALVFTLSARPAAFSAGIRQPVDHKPRYIAFCKLAGGYASLPISGIRYSGDGLLRGRHKTQLRRPRIPPVVLLASEDLDPRIEHLDAPLPSGQYQSENFQP